ncbi:hypothetical protein ASG27_00300 [Acidovorax sp. Leaf191]|uniref:hypothetical protein n=1 Tax=Acidovorax sp. Leaf191 TaxID=1736296 RepID=UPI0006FC6DC9|nr:hypothetical protein [Acidovorax sp. Leaf191]KQS42291.1 hypothetical protein ASG27_00300 [Acidovorax sp. Leaf191]
MSLVLLLVGGFVTVYAALRALAALLELPHQARGQGQIELGGQVPPAEVRALVAAEASTVAQTRSIEPAGSRVVTYKSTADRAAVRAQAAEAVRAGTIPSGEISAM